MKYKAYPEYKDSGVEWLAELPVHWKISKMRYMFSFGKGLTITKLDLSDEGVPCVNYGEVHSKYGFKVDPAVHPLKCVSEDYLKSSPSALLSRGDLVFADTSEDIEGSGNFTQLTSEQPIFAGYHTIIARPVDRGCSRFYAYLLDSLELRTQIRHAVKGVKVFSVTQAIMRGVNIWLPGLEERKKIANFLDHETAKIDTLIEKQQQLIKLLKEKRQAVISHAVTKGLDPDAPMRDSGVEWLGEVPEHWKVSKLGLLAFMQEGPGLRTWQFKDYGTRVICVTNITEDGINFSKLEKFISKEEYMQSYQHFTVNRDDILLSSSGNSWGKVAKYEGDEKVILNTSTIRLNELKHQPLVSQYIQNFLTSEACREQLGIAMTGSCQPNFGPTHLNEVMTPIPPLSEQKQIAKFLDMKTTKIDKLISKAEQAIKLIKERRTALISAAVTGKIDVRHEVTL